MTIPTHPEDTMSTNGSAADTEVAQNTSLQQQQLARMRFARKAGLQYGGKRDVYEVAGYVPEDELTFQHFWSRYRRDPVAGRIVDMPAMTTWRNPPRLVEPDADPEEPTEFMQAFDSLSDRLKLWHRLERTDRLAGIGRYGVLLIGVAGDSELTDELPKLSGPDDVIFLASYDEAHAAVEKWDADPSSRRFGMPAQYKITLAGDLTGEVSGFPEGHAFVHHTRVVHAAEDLLTDEVFGRPRLERVHNLLHDLEKVTAATGEAYWQIAARILQLGIDADAQIGEEDLKELGQAVEELYHDLRRHIAVQGGELSWLAGEPPDPTGAHDLFMTLFAVGCGIPKRILFGSETGERASTEDQKTWLGQIAERQERFAEPVMLRPLVDRLIEHGALPKPSQGYEVTWPNLFETPAKEIAETSKLTAETARALTPVGAEPLTLVSIEDGVPRLKDSAELSDDPFVIDDDDGDEFGTEPVDE